MPKLTEILNLGAFTQPQRQALQEALGAMLDGQQDLATKVDALTAKMDADFATVTGADTDYASTIGDATDALDALITD